MGIMGVIHWDPHTDGPLSESSMREKLEALGYQVTRYDYPPGTHFPRHTHDVDKIVTASDFKDRQFGDSYGVHVKESGLLARAVFVVGKDDTVKHVEYVPIITQLPDFDAAVAAATSA